MLPPLKCPVIVTSAVESRFSDRPSTPGQISPVLAIEDLTVLFFHTVSSSQKSFAPGSLFSQCFIFMRALYLMLYRTLLGLTSEAFSGFLSGGGRVIFRGLQKSPRGWRKNCVQPLSEFDILDTCYKEIHQKHFFYFFLFSLFL